MRVEDRNDPKEIVRRLRAKRHVAFTVKNQDELNRVLVRVNETVGTDYYMVSRDTSNDTWDRLGEMDNIHMKVFYLVLPPEKE